VAVKKAAVGSVLVKEDLPLISFPAAAASFPPLQYADKSSRRKSRYPFLVSFIFYICNGIIVKTIYED
jgi:hypothetical protein